MKMILKGNFSPEFLKPITQGEKMNIQKHIALLGLKAKDKVTGFTGTITCVSFDLYGCIQAILTPDLKKDEKEYKNGCWFDIRRLEIKSKSPVMPVPDFEYGNIAEGKQGCADKPSTNFNMGLK